MFAEWFPSQFPIRDPVLIFAIVLVLFLASPIVMGRLRLPGMIGLLLAGAILGPNALGILARDASFVLLGAVGLIYIMFTAALEIDLGVFRKYGAQGIVFGLLTFSIPQGVGTAIAYYALGFELLPAVLLASMFASHTLLAYPIASRLGLATNRAVTATVGGTMITDTLALLVLAVIAGMAQGEVNEAFWWRLGVSLTIFVGAILFGLPRLGRWFFRRVGKDGPAEFVFVLTSVFLCAALSHTAGLEPIVGAFLAGIALNRLIPHHGTLMNRLTFTGEAIFIPFFLLSVGMLLDARVLFGGVRTWIVALAMCGTVIATKWLAAQVARLVFRYRRDEGDIMFGLSVVQAAATLAAVMVGHRIGLFDDAVVNGTIVMILATCVLGPWVVARASATLAASRATKKTGAGDAAAGAILVPLVSPAQAEAAVELALLLRSEPNERIHPAFAATDGKELAAAMASGDEALAHAVAQASAADCFAEPIRRVGDDPGRALVSARKEIGAATVVVPWDGAASSSAARFGRVIDTLAADGGATLLLSHVPHPLGTCARIVLFLPPGSGGARGLESALGTLAHVAKQLGAPVVALAPEAERKPLERALSGMELRAEVSPYPSVRGWLPVLTERLRDDDLIVVVALRADEEAEHPDARGIAQRIRARFADHDVIVIFGADAPVELAAAPGAEPPAPSEAAAG